jgi:RNA polymerase sigma-70 factor, ECF subfamily
MIADPLEQDRAWTIAFKRGDRDALERVFLTYSDDIARQVRATRVREHEVESLVHDVFLKAFADSARLAWDGLRPFGAWLNTMTRNLLIDRARKERRLDSRAPESMPLMVDERPSADQHHDERELQAALGQFRDGMGADDVALYEARFERQLSLAQTAKALGWSEIRVRKLDTALRTRLLGALHAAGFLRDAKVRIGASLLGRKTSQEGG